MTTPEGRVKQQVKDLLKRYDAYQHWPVLNGMGAPTLDCIACVNGRFLAIECKAPGKEPTERQSKTMGAMSLANATVFVVSNSAQLYTLEVWLSQVKETPWTAQPE